MKILYICTVELSRNGIITWIQSYSHQLKKLDENIDIGIITPFISDQSLISEFTKDGILITEIKNRKSNPLKYMFNLYKLLANNRYDIIHIHGNSALMVIELVICAIAKIKVRIVHAHNTKTEFPIIEKLCRPLFYRLYSNAIACSNAAGEFLYKENSFTVIKNVIEIDKFIFDSITRNKVRIELGVNDEMLIGHIGLFEKVKNQAFLINVLKRLKRELLNCKLLLIGEGTLKKELEILVNELDLSSFVIFLGNTSIVEKYYHAMDLFALPSLHEGLPYVLIEAQTSSTPCIVSNRVSKEACLSNDFDFLELDEIIWMNKIREYCGSSYIQKEAKNIDKIEKEFDLERNCMILFDYYQTCLRELA
ncbi:glycosyltransferase [Amedibacillus sp. YH-ame10]